MAKIEFPESTRKRLEQIGSADLLIGITGAVSADELRAKMGAVFVNGSSFSNIVVAFAGADGVEDFAGDTDSPFRYITYPLLSQDPDSVPWGEMGISQRSVLALASSIGAQVCLVLHADIAALQAQSIALLAQPVIENKCELVTPIYPFGKYEGLINSGILSPLVRALYGKRIRQPLPFDFSVSTRICSRLSQGDQRNGYTGPSLVWPATIPAIESAPISQAYLDVQHPVHTDGLELSTVLAQLAGSVFLEMETHAAHWQRVRGSQPTPLWGTPAKSFMHSEPVDARPMIDSFLLGSRNLDEVWRFVLPPETLLELKRLTRLAPEQFRMPDTLWARIVYDFALAHRLRTISRTHLLGAFTPLYLGWVASYVQEVAAASPTAAEQRLEQLARAYEENKPYLVSRWRWPDRFNP